jgi:hypothetical protein
MRALTESMLDRFGFPLPRNEDQVHGNTGEDHETAIAWNVDSFMTVCRQGTVFTLDSLLPQDLFYDLYS